MKILVTGGCGFIGSHIVDAYINLGHTVVVIDNLSTGDVKNLNPKATFYKEDISDTTIETIFKQEHCDCINHHAAQINVRTSVENPLYDAQVNIMGSLNLLTLAAKYGVKRFVFASSGGTVYGEPNDFPITEEALINPASPYGISKATVEKYLSLFATLYNFDTVILRYSNVYGPRQIGKGEAGVIAIFINQILGHKKCVVFGDGNQTRDYVYVADVVQANVTALHCAPTIVNIGTAIETSVNDLVHMLATTTKQHVDYEYGAQRPGEVQRNVLDFSKATAVLQWKPETPLDQGLHKTFEYFKELS